MVYGFWIVIIFTLLYEPIIGYFDFQKFKVEVKRNDNVRLKYYKNIITTLWVPTVFILLLVAFTELTLTDIGLSIPSLNTELLGPFVTYFAFAIGLLYACGILYYSIGYHVSGKIRKKLAEVRAKQMGESSYSDILPVTRIEKKVWNAVSLTAGVTEEIIYRGFLLFAFTYLFPTMSIWIIIIICSLLFGLGHTYQGFIKGVLRTTIFGVIFSILFIGMGSIIPLIILHFLIDYMAKLGES
ncbi:CPBP family intramembrane glutamic endopeptidase [Sporosarcina contaminans]|uniref:CPBP family intramembrane glutamic endopeptidase n=1 Tax=Sporosarcina contaminans TaxID=633403 RepID=A0ABW3U3T2_9BACL